MIAPCKVTVLDVEDGLLLATVHLYVPAVLTLFKVCVYCAVTGSSNTVSFPSVIVVESLVQVTVVTGPPVEIQVSMNCPASNTMSSDTVMSEWDELFLCRKQRGIDLCIYILCMKEILWKALKSH